MTLEGQALQNQTRVELPPSDHHKNLIACQVACPVHTDARGMRERAVEMPAYLQSLLSWLNDGIESDRRPPEESVIAHEPTGPIGR